MTKVQIAHRERIKRIVKKFFTDNKILTKFEEGCNKTFNSIFNEYYNKYLKNIELYGDFTAIDFLIIDIKYIFVHYNFPYEKYNLDENKNLNTKYKDLYKQYIHNNYKTLMNC